MKCPFQTPIKAETDDGCAETFITADDQGLIGVIRAATGEELAFIVLAVNSYGQLQRALYELLVKIDTAPYAVRQPLSKETECAKRVLGASFGASTFGFDGQDVLHKFKDAGLDQQRY